MAQHTINLPCIADTYVDSANPGSNYGALNQGIIHQLNSGSISTVAKSAYFLFDPNTWPVRKRIIGYILRLYVINKLAGLNNDITNMRTTNFNAADEYTATWNTHSILPNKFSRKIDGVQTGQYQDFPVSSDLMPGEAVVLGIFSYAPTTAESSMTFATRESSNPPLLVVTYEDVPPSAPTPKSPIGAYKDSKSVIRFAWQYNSDVGGTQKAFDLQWSTDQINWTTVSQTISNMYYDMPADTLPAGNIYWRVRCYNEYDEVGPYCDIQSFYAIGAPAAPVLNAIPSNTARPVVSWSAFSQQVYQLQVLSGDSIVYDSGIVPGINIRQHKIKAWLADGEYTVKLRIKNEYDMWSAWGSAAVTISTEKPEKPSVNLQRSTIGIELHIEGIADYALIYRSDYGADDYVCIGKTTSTTYIDNSVRNKAEYQYYVRSVAEMASDVETYEDSDIQFIQAEFRHSLIAPVSDLSNIFAFTRSLNTPPKRVYDRAPGGAAVLYAGRIYPVWEPTEHISAGLSLSFFLRTWAEVESFVALYDRKETALYRDVKGRKIYGVMSGLQVTEERTGYVVSFLLNQVDHDEETEV